MHVIKKVLNEPITGLKSIKHTYTLSYLQSLCLCMSYFMSYTFVYDAINRKKGYYHISLSQACMQKCIFFVDYRRFPKISVSLNIRHSPCFERNVL